MPLTDKLKASLNGNLHIIGIKALVAHSVRSCSTQNKQ